MEKSDNIKTQTPPKKNQEKIEPQPKNVVGQLLLKENDIVSEINPIQTLINNQQKSNFFEKPK